MSQAARAKAVTAFRSDPELRVFLVSIKAGGLGLNLTVASVVFLLDPWWNPAVEDQAINRVHRLGQKRPVRVHRLVVGDTVEERMLRLQAKKQQLADSALSAGIKQEVNRMSLEDLKLLFS
eukprot:PLAT3885.3.p2 GENE.PLAT3885.3~~PLAT3885.3.p2  ORF type:complete len:121 (+),score=41.82 PLAT3885.3:3-365(+)